MYLSVGGMVVPCLALTLEVRQCLLGTRPVLTHFSKRAVSSSSVRKAPTDVTLSAVALLVIQDGGAFAWSGAQPQWRDRQSIPLELVNLDSACWDSSSVV